MVLVEFMYQCTQKFPSDMDVLKAHDIIDSAEEEVSSNLSAK